MIRVLVVEDDPMVTDLYKRYLALVKGFELAGTAANTDEAHAILEKTKIDLLLLDQYMPGATGIELLSRIRQSGIEVDCIMITAARDSYTVQYALRRGVVDYLVKPFNFERFQAALLAYGQRSRRMQDISPLNQSDIDQSILAKPQTSFTSLPKGIEQETLDRITNAAKASARDFSTEDLAQKVGISRVSLRKYLEYMKSTGKLHSRLVHRPIGRPISLYTYVGDK